MIDSDRILGALVLGGAADALGWRNESWRPGAKRTHTVEWLESWPKRIGRVGGYWEKIEAGEYSDDTQLTIAVARCVSPDGQYDADRFARIELPYWLSYQRGGGRTIKAAAASLRKNRELTWDSNRFAGYEASGANGAAMRVLALAVIEDPAKRIEATWQNAVATHGHPRAIIGALVMTEGLALALRASTFEPKEYVYQLKEFIRQLNLDMTDERLRRWIHSMLSVGFEQRFKGTQREMLSFIDTIWSNLSGEDRKVLQLLGCFDPRTRGSGTATVAAGNYFFLKYYGSPIRGIIRAANAHGTDTDTIGKFTGNLLGALRGRETYESELTERVQDRTYFDRLSNYLAGDEPPHWNGHTEGETVLSENLKEGDTYFSKILGFGEVTKVIPPRLIARGEMVLLETRVAFECGQSCYFTRSIPSKSRHHSIIREKDQRKLDLTD